MKIEELRTKMAALVKELGDMKILTETERRSPTDEEKEKSLNLITEINTVDSEISEMELRDDIDATLARAKESRKKMVRPDVGASGGGEKKEFRSFGEFLQAVYAAAQSGGYQDPRLTRAATGLSEGIPSDGGYLVQTDFASDLIKRTYETGQVVSRTRRIPVSGNSNGLKLNAVAETSRVNGSRWGGIVSYWLAEAGDKTASAPKFRQMELSLKKLIGLCYATDELLQDASALESVIRQGFAEEFGFKLDDACINGSGVGQPLGILNSNCLVSVARNTASQINSEDIIGMWARAYAKARTNAVWFINQDIEPYLYKMSLAVGTAGGQLTYMQPGGLSNSPYATLMGRPVIAIEQCQTLGTKGDIYLADFGEYILIDKGGIQSASSIHVKFTNDETTFRFVYRCDGQPIWNAALTPYKGSNTLSPFVCLAA